MPTVRIQEKNYSESIMVLKLKDGRALYHERIGWLNCHKKEVAVYENPCYNFLIQYIILKPDFQS